MATTLYDFELSADCYALRLMLSILGVQYEAVAIDIYPGTDNQAEWFLKLNPAGTLPVLVAQDEGWAQLAKEGFAGKLMAMDKKRARMEKEGELKAQTHTVGSLNQAIAQSEQRIAQITSSYRSQLLNERPSIQESDRQMT